MASPWIYFFSHSFGKWLAIYIFDFLSLFLSETKKSFLSRARREQRAFFTGKFWLPNTNTGVKTRPSQTTTKLRSLWYKTWKKHNFIFWNGYLYENNFIHKHTASSYNIINVYLHWNVEILELCLTIVCVFVYFHNVCIHW